MRFHLALAPLLLIASPASAQFWGGPSGGISGGMPVSARPASGPAVANETGQIRRDIRRGRESGQLSRREARQLRYEANRLAMLEARYRQGGLSYAEEAELFTRRQLLREEVIARRSAAR